MTPITVTSVRSGRQRRQFVELPWKLYRNDPNWIPPLRQNIKELLGYKRHPFHEVAEVETFLAIRNGEVCGRIAAILNHVHNQRFNERRGFFGFFECIDDDEVARALFETVQAWCRERQCTAIRGPMNPSFNYEMGLLIDGFDSPPTFMMTYNPPFYERLVEANGFDKSQDLYAYWAHAEMLATVDKKLDFIATEAKRRFQFHLRPLNKAKFREEIQTFLHIYNSANAGHWGFVPLTDNEIKHMSDGMRHLIVPDLTTVAEVDGRAVGTVFGMLDYNPRIKQIDGRLFPFGFLRLLSNRRAITRVRLIAAHVLPEYQRWGLGLVMLAELVSWGLDWGIKEAELSWIAESNTLSLQSVKRGGAKLIKTFRIYDADITSGK